mmetsp:Transcript_112847/g.240853  ORF Transcript_112847/g.240853 Transcript_112847/m.240853 type:complete len:202 (-) Transcript_112847:110-715(-)
MRLSSMTGTGDRAAGAPATTVAPLAGEGGITSSPPLQESPRETRLRKALGDEGTACAAALLLPFASCLASPGLSLSGGSVATSLRAARSAACAAREAQRAARCSANSNASTLLSPSRSRRQQAATAMETTKASWAKPERRGQGLLPRMSRTSPEGPSMIAQGNNCATASDDSLLSRPRPQSPKPATTRRGKSTNSHKIKAP